MTLAEEWFTYIVGPEVDVTLPGIYEWHIEGVGSYIGKYTHISRPRTEYGRNVSRLLAKLPYRKNKPVGFRHIHRQLEAAIKAGNRISLTILENVNPELLNAREQELIKLRGVLNRTSHKS